MCVCLTSRAMGTTSRPRGLPINKGSLLLSQSQYIPFIQKSTIRSIERSLPHSSTLSASLLPKRVFWDIDCGVGSILVNLQLRWSIERYHCNTHTSLFRVSSPAPFHEHGYFVIRDRLIKLLRDQHNEFVLAFVDNNTPQYVNLAFRAICKRHRSF